VLALPLIASFPDQPPEAVQLLALLEDQLNVVAAPERTVPGVALTLSTGAAAAGDETAWGATLAALSAELPPPQPLKLAATAAHSASDWKPCGKSASRSAVRIESHLGSPQGRRRGRSPFPSMEW